MYINEDHSVVDALHFRGLRLLLFSDLEFPETVHVIIPFTLLYN